MAESRSILTADFGSVYTRVLLLDVVGGGYRIVSRAEVRSTGGFPAGDVTLGLRQAVTRIARVTGRKLLDDSGRLITPEGENRSGVDLFLATASGGRPLRTILIGLMPGVSVESGIRATEGTYVNVEEVISLDETRTEEEQLNAILSVRPDLLIMVGGTEGGATAPMKRLLKLVKTVMATFMEGERPTLLYAGNSDLASDVSLELGELTTVFIADNVRPSLDEEELDSARFQLSRVFDRYKESQGHGFDYVGTMSTTGLFPNARSYSVVAEYLGKSRGDVEGVIVVDVGSATGTLASYVDGDTKTTIRTDLGVGTSAPDTVISLDIEDIRRWIPYSIAEADVMNYALNKRLRPATIPSTRKQMYIEHALLRASIANMIQDQREEWAKASPRADIVIGTGSTLANTGNPGMSAMLLLDAVQPDGVVDLYTDPNGVISSMGALAYVAPEAAVQLLDGNSLEHLGTVFGVSGTPNTSRAALHYKIVYEDGEVSEDNIDGGLFVIFDLPPGKSATVTVTAKGGLRINGKRKVTREVSGGVGGIIFDTRGRPLPLGLTLKERMIRLSVWYTLASGVYHEEISEDDLEPVEEREMILPMALHMEPEEPEQGRRRRGRKDEAQEAAVTDVQALLDDSDIDLEELENIFEGDLELDLDDINSEDEFDELLR